MVLTCERCKREIYKTEACNYCSRKICLECIKASQKASKLSRLVICKDCWGDMVKRTAYKNRQDMAALARAQAAAARG